jgi:hypothetical protein
MDTENKLVVTKEEKRGGPRAMHFPKMGEAGVHKLPREAVPE